VKGRALIIAVILGVALLGFPEAARASEGNSILFGHNLSPTTYTLKKGVASFGNFVAGLGVTDNLTLGVSPWMYTSYNMYSFVARYGKALDDDHRLGVQAAYFKTDHINNDIYQMDAASVWTTIGRRVTSYYTIDLIGNYMYFFDETIPFSLRREPHNNQPWQISLTTLQEIRLPEGFGLTAEIGVLGLNYAYPQAFVGASMNWRNEWLLVQLGYSQNSTVTGFNRLYTSDQAAMNRDASDDQAVHPEVHFQAFF